MIYRLDRYQDMDLGFIQSDLGQKYINQEIIGASLAEEEKIILFFKDNAALVILDDGQCCCEHRYIRTDDDISSLIGKKLKNIELKGTEKNHIDILDYREIQFLEISTDQNFVTFSAHNENNGWYGGFSIEIREIFND